MQLDLTPEFCHALELLERGARNLFVTGRAGTGKSTLLQYFRETTRKNVVVLAPTGVAAVNVGGETIHSFFRFKPDITPDRVKKLGQTKQELFQKIDTLIVDEISMVRADLLDAVAKFLQLNRPTPRRPFGGAQMVLFGDLYQLPPVVQRKEEELFRSHYESPYFFSAKSFDSLRLEWVDLTKVFRQTDDAFLDILNRIRNGTVLDEDLARLNSRVREEIEFDSLDEFVFLTTTNDRARAINRHQLDRLSAKKQTFLASVTGTFDAASFPTDYELELKEGSQVMLLNNDNLGRWVNGTIAKIKKIDARMERLIVILPDGSEEEVKPYRWDMFHFELDKNSRRLIPVSLGQFVQFPVRLAWAITIHKSQGLTFDKVVLDLSRGTFAHGQLYVALSRLRTLAGLILTRPVKKGHILLDRRIQKFITGYQYRLSDAKVPLQDKIALIQDAIKNGRDLEIVYLKGSDEKSQRRVTPIAVSEMEFQSRLFQGLAAYCHSRRGERVFRVDRILELKTVDRSLYNPHSKQ
ncbi:MAG: AAA family ATPase [Deltaproteobacteria bacterium]|nr:AAA family ATPase [Deltaproteobacteria bacterium]